MTFKKRMKRCGWKTCLLCFFIPFVVVSASGSFQPSSSAGLLDCPVKRQYDLFAPAPEAVRLIGQISLSAGTEANFTIWAADFGESTPIAMAAICEGDRYILYDKNRHFRFADGRTDWQAVTILAHEVGHHVNGDTFNNTEPHAQELAADYMGGFIVRKLGGSMEQALKMTERLSATGSDTHPARPKRMQAVIEGWNRAKNNLAWENRHCTATEWLGEAFAVEERQCRQIKLCRAGAVDYRVACESDTGKWLVQ